MTAPLKRRTRRRASPYSFTSKALRAWLPTKLSFSTWARTKPRAIFLLRKTWARAPLHQQLPRQRPLRLRLSPLRSSAGLHAVYIASPVPHPGNSSRHRASVFFAAVLRCQIGQYFFLLVAARPFISISPAFSC